MIILALTLWLKVPLIIIGVIIGLFICAELWDTRYRNK